MDGRPIPRTSLWHPTQRHLLNDAVRQSISNLLIPSADRLPSPAAAASTPRDRKVLLMILPAILLQFGDAGAAEGESVVKTVKKSGKKEDGSKGVSFKSSSRLEALMAMLAALSFSEAMEGVLKSKTDDFDSRNMRYVNQCARMVCLSCVASLCRTLESDKLKYVFERTSDLVTDSLHLKPHLRKLGISNLLSSALFKLLNPHPGETVEENQCVACFPAKGAEVFLKVSRMLRDLAYSSNDSNALMRRLEMIEFWAMSALKVLGHLAKEKDNKIIPRDKV
ncbi:hypothetical protein HDU67_002793 [Dinochytrium kinnereticum]|nr:hypothetical protein HDU67_002793 [Dinochytrium kinnereticum]